MIRMIQDKIAVKPDPKLDKVGSIFIPERYQSTLWSGTVIAIGPGDYDAKGRFIPTELKPGQHIVIDTARAVEVRVEGEELMFTREGEVLGIVDEGGEVLTWKNEGRMTRREWEEVKRNTDAGKVTRPEQV